MAPRKSRRKVAKHKRTRRHDWTHFENHTLMCLLIRNVHKTGLESDELDSLSKPTATQRKTSRKKQDATPGKLAYVDVATALNKACNKSSYEKDISLEDVREMVDHFLEDKKAAVAALERQPIRRVTRSMKDIWYRGLNFDGSKKEWEAGRKAAEEIKRRDDRERRLNVGAAGLIIAGLNVGGVAGGWGGDNSPVEVGWGTGSKNIDKETSAAEKAGAWGDAMELDPPVTATNDAWGTAPTTSIVIMEKNTDLWSSAAVDAAPAVTSNAMNSWGAGSGGTISSKSTTTAWEEPKASKKANTATVSTAAVWSGTEDHFASPLRTSNASNWPANACSTTAKVTAQSNAWGAPDAFGATNISTIAGSSLWGGATFDSNNQISGAVEDAWGSNAKKSNSGSSFPNIASSRDIAKNSLPDAADTTTDLWGTNPISIPIQSASMGWSADGANMTPAHSAVAGAVDPTGPLGISSGKSVSEDRSNFCESLAVDPLNADATTVTSGLGSNIEIAQGRTSPSKTNLAANFESNTPFSSKPRTSGNFGSVGWGAPQSDTTSSRNAPSHTFGDSVNLGEESRWDQQDVSTASSSTMASSNSQGGAFDDPWGVLTPSNILVDPSTFSHLKTTTSIINRHGQAQSGKIQASVPKGWGAAPNVPGDLFVDTLAASDKVSLWTKPSEDPSEPSAIESSFSFQISNPDVSNSDTVAQLSLSGINPERLVMLASAAADDQGQAKDEIFADGGKKSGQKNLKAKSAFVSKDNAIPLKFNRLTGMRAESGTGGEGPSGGDAARENDTT